MALSDTHSKEEVNNAIEELKACIEDAKRGGAFRDLEEHLPRLAYLLQHDRVLVQVLSDLPKTEIEALIADAEEDCSREFNLSFSPEPKARLSKQVTILVAIGLGRLNIWDFSVKCFARNPSKFWEDIFFPATRDLLRYATSVQKEFIEQRKTGIPSQKQKMSATKNYSLDLFISHSSKDENFAKALVEFLRAALAIPHDRVRCTSVNGYKLSAGATTEDALRREIHESHCFIGLITPDSSKSQFVLFELGARWGSQEHLVPLLAGGMRPSDLRPPLSNLNALNCADEEEMHQLVHDLARTLKKAVPLPAAYKGQLSTLLKTQESGWKTVLG